MYSLRIQVGYNFNCQPLWEQYASERYISSSVSIEPNGLPERQEITLWRCVGSPFEGISTGDICLLKLVSSPCQTGPLVRTPRRCHQRMVGGLASGFGVSPRHVQASRNSLRKVPYSILRAPRFLSQSHQLITKH